MDGRLARSAAVDHPVTAVVEELALIARDIDALVDLGLAGVATVDLAIDAVEEDLLWRRAGAR
jgi:hypothetical protein